MTSSEGFRPAHGYYCGEMAWGDTDGDGDRDFAFAGQGGGFLGWFENRGNSDSRTDGDFRALVQ
ncbi:MAG TPA: hypothetical protein VMY37_35625 [Thermoguttaceae bacterium]|nr:hypothetical protein [Thermoguttaceae bacterium]